MQCFEEKCAICGKFFKTKAGLTSHLATHTKEYFKCKFCTPDCHYAAEKSFRKHLRWHAQGEQHHTCEVVLSNGETCGKKFEWPNQLKIHGLSHQPPTKACRVHKNCAAIYTFDTERNHHEQHGLAKRIFKCIPCNQTFKDSTNREIHMIRFHFHERNNNNLYIGPGEAPPEHFIQKSKSGTAKQQTFQEPSTQDDNTTDEPAAPVIKPRRPKGRRNNVVANKPNVREGDPNLAVPLVANLDTTTTTVTLENVSSGSEYIPSDHERRHAYDSDHLPDL